MTDLADEIRAEETRKAITREPLFRNTCNSWWFQHRWGPWRGIYAGSSLQISNCLMCNKQRRNY